MTETGILNRDIAAEMIKLGHTDRMLIADAGLPIPNDIRVIDLALKENVPNTVEVLREILRHFSVEKFFMSEDISRVNPSREKEYRDMFDKNVESELVKHTDFKSVLIPTVKFAIRTGDFIAYSNVILVASGGPRWYNEK